MTVDKKILLNEEEKELLDVVETLQYVTNKKGKDKKVPRVGYRDTSGKYRRNKEGFGSIHYGDRSKIIRYDGEWANDENVNDGKFTLQDGSTYEVKWNGKKITEAIFITKDCDKFYITDVGDTITVQHGSHILYIRDKSYSFGQMDNQGQLCGIVKEANIF